MIILNFTTGEDEEEEEYDDSWSTNLWKVLNNESSSAVEIGVSVFVIVVVVAIVLGIVIRCSAKRKDKGSSSRGTALPPVPMSRFFADDSGGDGRQLQVSEGLYDLIDGSSKSHRSSAEKQASATSGATKGHLEVTQATTASGSTNNSSNNEYSRDPTTTTTLLTSSDASNDDAESPNPTPRGPDGRIVFAYEATEARPTSAGRDVIVGAKFQHARVGPEVESRSATLDRPLKRKRRQRTSKQKSLDFHLSKTQADICNFYLPMAVNKSISVDELNWGTTTAIPTRPADEGCESEYIAVNTLPRPFAVPVIVITTPNQEKDLYLLKDPR